MTMPIAIGMVLSLDCSARRSSARECSAGVSTWSMRLFSEGEAIH